MNRRRFLGVACAAGAAAPFGALGRRAGSTPALPPSESIGAPPKPAPAHSVEAPPSMNLSVLTVEEPILYGKPTPAVIAIPRSMSPGARLPLAVLLPGGEHTMQRREQGCWGWWSDFHLAESIEAVHRGKLTSADLHGFASDAQIASLSSRLSTFRDMIVVTPFILRRQTELGPHGKMNLPFLRALVTRVRKDFPVLADREATGLAGVSAGALWALWLGAQLDDLFSTVVAVQPYTDGYEKTLTKVLKARKLPQRVRIVTSSGDKLHAPAVSFVEKMGKESVTLERETYAGPHAPEFAAGPGGFEVLATMSESLRFATASTPAPASVSASAPALPSATATAPASTPTPAPVPVAPRSHLWPFVALSALGVAAGVGLAALRCRRRD